MHYNWHRHYDATIARYTQPDPIGLAAGSSVYAYVTNSPQMYTDPEGLDAAVGATVGGTFGGPPGAAAGAAVGLGVAAGVACYSSQSCSNIAKQCLDFALSPTKMTDVMSIIMQAKGGKQNIRDTGLTDMDITDINSALSGENGVKLSKKDKRRYQKEQKAREQRNKQKRKK